MNISDALSRQAVARPSPPAIIDGDRSITYQLLDRLVRKTAAHLLDLGIGSGDRVGLCLKDNADYLIASLAVARMGAVILPMDWRAKEKERARLAAAFDVNLALIEAGTKAPPSMPTAAQGGAPQAHRLGLSALPPGC